MTKPNWVILYSESSLKDISKIHKKDQERIFSYLGKRITSAKSPRLFGKATKGKIKGLWRYRVGDYRILVDILDSKIVVHVISVGHRKSIYD